MRKSTKRAHVLALTAAVVLFAPAAADAATMFSANGIASAVTADVTFDYTATDDTSGTVQITIENTSGTTGGVTGFAFNAPSGLSFTSFNAVGWDAWETDPANSGALNYDGINAPQISGNFDFGACNKNNNCNPITGGNLNPGILDGETGIFTIGLSAASGMSSLTDLSFLGLLTNVDNNGDQQTPFAVRFQGLPDSYNTGSDVAIPTQIPVGNIPPVPLPAAAWLLLSALGGLGFAGWRNRKVAAA